jgi:outer membrane biosynthesis protein TonB
MQPTTQTDMMRSMIIYILIGVALLGAVILGVRWAKGRSDQYAQAGKNPTSTTTQQPAQKQPDSSKPSDQNKQQATTPPQQPAVKPPVAAAPSTPQPQPAPASNPSASRVPSTGIEDAVLPIFALALLTFASIRYLQSHRRLHSLS